MTFSTNSDDMSEKATDNFSSQQLLGISIIDSVGIKAGLDQYNRSLAKALIARGCQVDVYSNFIDEENSFIQKVFDFFPGSGFQSGNSVIKGFLTSLRKSSKGNKKIVILHLFHAYWVDYFLILLAKIYKFRICLIVHDIESLLHPGKKSSIKKCLNLSDYIIVHNEFCKEELIKKAGDSFREKISIIPHGNFIEEEKGSGPGSLPGEIKFDKKNYVLFFGMIKKSKGLDILLEAMKEVDKDVHLIVAGRLRDETAYRIEERINQFGVSDRVQLVFRYITNEERNSLFNRCSIVVLPYKRVYQSGVLLQAMSHGIPVIASNIPGNSLVKDGNNGILFEADSSSDLAAKINSLSVDENKRKYIAENAKSYAALNHSWNMIGDEFVKVFRK
jgi:glycosyltransferase involved in cell wall biosynthesis